MIGKQCIIVSTEHGKKAQKVGKTGLSEPFSGLFLAIVNISQLPGTQALSGSVNWSGERNPEPESLHCISANSLSPKQLGGGSPCLAGREADMCGRPPLPTTNFSRTTLSRQSPTPLPKSPKTQKIKFFKRGVAWNVVSTPINTRILKIGISGKNDINTVSTAYSFTSTEQNISQS